jgi:hypothetical protein
MVPEDPSIAAPTRRLLDYDKAALVLFVLDGFIFAQGVITALAALLVVVFGLGHIAVGIGRDRSRVLHGLRVIAVYVALCGAVLGTIHINNLIARKRANRIVAALKAYKGKHGHYPKRLADLVPEYIPNVPLAKYTLLFNQFHYYYDVDDERGSLWYIALPPFGRPIYSLETQTWGYLD